MCPVTLSAEDIATYYEGFSNATLWPLYHDVIVKPTYHREWWDSYVDVNRRFAEATARVAAQGATVWVQDYQLQLVPKMLRMLRPDLAIGFFLHIPFPPVELFIQMPWRTEIIEGLLGADLVGIPLARRCTELPGAGPAATRGQRVPGRGRRSVPARRGTGRLPQGEGRRLPDLDRLGARWTPRARNREIRRRARQIRS